MEHALEPFTSAGVFGALDLELASLLERLTGKLSRGAAISIACASRAPRLGHVCVPLTDLGIVARSESQVDAEELPWPDPATLEEELMNTGLVRHAGSAEVTPLVLRGSHLYLDRLYLDEEIVAAGIKRRLSRERGKTAEDEKRIKSMLERLFHHPDHAAEPEQMRATESVLCRDFAVLSGGPGTGKTTTVTRILAGWLEEHAHAHPEGPPLKIQLLAPTGKAAARLKESIQSQLTLLDSPLRDQIPDAASTIHRALRPFPDSPGRFRHGPSAPIPVDAVVLDEASMVDMTLLARLFEALPERARLLLVGDQDQLASVSAGAVMSDVAGASSGGGTLDSASPDAPPPPPIASAVIRLGKSHRFREGSALGRLAARVNRGDADGALRCLREAGARGDIRLVAPAKDGTLPRELITRTTQSYDYVASIPSAEQALEALGRIRVLCALRKGPAGVEQTNKLLSRSLEKRLDVPADSAFWAGQVILVNRNDYGLRLYNGDVGLIRQGPGQSRTACFLGDEGVRRLTPTRLPPHEVAFAMTIHKSQGSEFDEVVVMLPGEVTPLLTRELIYTAITRARTKVTLVGTEPVLRAAIQKEVHRGSCLRDLLWAPSDTAPSPGRTPA